MISSISKNEIKIQQPDGLLLSFSEDLIFEIFSRLNFEDLANISVLNKRAVKLITKKIDKLEEKMVDLGNGPHSEFIKNQIPDKLKTFFYSGFFARMIPFFVSTPDGKITNKKNRSFLTDCLYGFLINSGNLSKIKKGLTFSEAVTLFDLLPGRLPSWLKIDDPTEKCKIFIWMCEDLIETVKRAKNNIEMKKTAKWIKQAKSTTFKKEMVYIACQVLLEDSLKSFKKGDVDGAKNIFFNMLWLSVVCLEDSMRRDKLIFSKNSHIRQFLSKVCVNHRYYKNRELEITCIFFENLIEAGTCDNKIEKDFFNAAINILKSIHYRGVEAGLFISALVRFLYDFKNIKIDVEDCERGVAVKDLLIRWDGDNKVLKSLISKYFPNLNL